MILGLIGVPLLHQDGDQADHLRDVVGRRRIDFGRFDIEGFEILKKGLLVFRGEIAQRNPGRPGIADGLVVHIGQVHDLADPVTEKLERAAQQVLEHIGAEVADMRIVVDGGTAGVHADFAGPDRMKRNDAPLHGIEKFEAHKLSHH